MERRNVLTIIRRAVLPGLLLIIGLASLIYGARFHHVPVLVEEKSETTVEVLQPFPQVPPPFPGAQGFEEPPQIRKQTVQRTVEVAIIESEPSLIREVSIGGVALNGSREIKRTYSGKPPSLCPT